MLDPSDVVYAPILEFFAFPSGLITKKRRVGPQGGPVERYIASAEVVDHQGDVISVMALSEEMDTYIKGMGGIFQGLHTNFPAGRIFDWGFAKIDGILALWVDVEFYTYYESQREFYKRTQLPVNHKDKIGGISLGGKSLKSERKCDANGCVTHITKLEAWENSGVKNPANPLARRILDDGTLEGVGAKVQFFDRDEFSSSIGKSTSEDTSMDEQYRDPETGRFLTKGDTDCETCPDELLKGTCPKCETPMDGESCPKCDKEDEAPTEEGAPEGEPKEESSDNPEGGNAKMDGETRPDMGQNEPEAKQNMPEGNESQEFPEPSNGDEQLSQEINQKLDTMMEALNIEKEKRDKELSELRDIVKTLAVQVVGEPEPVKEIEHEGRTYVLKTKEPVAETLTKSADPMQAQVDALREAISGLAKQLGAPAPVSTGAFSQDDSITKSQGGEFPTSDVFLKEARIDGIVGAKHFNMVDHPDHYYPVHYDNDDLDVVARLQKHASETHVDTGYDYM